MATIELDWDKQLFAEPTSVQGGNDWNAYVCHAFQLESQARKGTGFYVRVFRLVPMEDIQPDGTQRTQEHAMTTVLKHITIKDGAAYVTFGAHRYCVGRVVA